MIDYVCPNCNHHMHVPEDQSGQPGQCESCGHAITFPDISGVNTDTAHAMPQHTPPAPDAPIPGEAPNAPGRFSLRWSGLTLNQQISLIGFALTLFLILMCAGFGWPGADTTSAAQESPESIHSASPVEPEEPAP